MKKQKYTAVELLVAMAIISSLLCLLLPWISRVKEYAYDIVCKNNMRQIALAYKFYAQDYKNNLPCPPSGYWLDDFTPLDPYTKSLNIYICPKSGSKIRNLSELAKGYADYYGYGKFSDNDKNNGLGNSPYGIDISNPGKSPAMQAFYASYQNTKRCVYENMRGQYNLLKRNHFKKFNIIYIDTLAFDKGYSLKGYFVLDSKRKIVTSFLDVDYRTYKY